jgi:S1-C subfamily serine protease
MFCSHCGAALEPEDEFCSSCGHRRRQDAGSEAPTVAIPAMPVSDPAPTAPRPSSSRRPWLIAAAVVGVLALGAGVGAVVAVAGNSGGSKPSGHGATATHTPGVAAAASTSNAPDSFAGLYREDSTGVVRIETVSCDGQGVGTGFLLSPTLVATVNHVVDQSSAISLVVAGQRTSGTVVGTDSSRDLALVRADKPLNGHLFTLSSTAPDVGSRVAAIGFPIGDPITLTQGGISGLDRTITIDGADRSGLIETDAAVNPGNSGGPLLTVSGDVVGLVDALNTEANGIAYAVPASTAAPLFAAWKSSPQPVAPAHCANAVGPRQENPPDIGTPGGNIPNEVKTAVSQALGTYFDGINSGNYAAAYAVLSPRMQAQFSYDSFAKNTATSYDNDFTVLGARQPDPNTVVIGIGFSSLQAPGYGPNGETCDNWTLDYTVIRGTDSNWLIDATAPHNGSTHTAC